MKKSVLLLGLLVACGGDDGDGPTIITPDAPGGGNVDASQPANCALAAELGTAPPSSETFFVIPEGETVPALYYTGAPLNQDAMPDILWVDLWDGYGAFENGFPTAGTTIQLTGDEAGADTCGACVSVWADATQQSREDYFATGGTLQLTSVSQTSVAGMLTNVTFAHVNIDEQSLATTPHPDGCTSALTSFSFSGTPMMEPANVAGAPQRWKLQLKKQK